jgi:hypothetical protein
MSSDPGLDLQVMANESVMIHAKQVCGGSRNACRRKRVWGKDNGKALPALALDSIMHVPAAFLTCVFTSADYDEHTEIR